jgi:hypothetical protein
MLIKKIRWLHAPKNGQFEMSSSIQGWDLIASSSFESMSPNTGRNRV